MISSSKPTCKGISNVNIVLTCFYDAASRTLKVTNLASVNLPLGTIISFSFDSFVNPYNGIVKSGFQITTMEITGRGMIDQSDILSIIVTDFA